MGLMLYLGCILLGERGCYENRSEPLDSTHKWGIPNVEEPVAEISVLGVGTTVHNDSDNDERLW